MKKKLGLRLGRRSPCYERGTRYLPCNILAKAEGGTNRETHAVARISQEIANQEDMYKLHVCAQVKVLGEILIGTAAKAIEVRCVVRLRGLQDSSR